MVVVETKAGRDLANRLKFGVEGGVFTGAIGLGGVGFNRLRKGPTDTGQSYYRSNGKILE